MSRINTYTATNTLDTSDRFIVDGTSGTRSISLANLASNIMSILSSIEHRNIWRGKYLGSSISTDQNTAISNGSFTDIFVGDYWTINSHNWRIVDINPIYNTGDVAFSKNHLALMPDVQLYNASMEDTDTTANGFGNSKMATDNLAQAISIAETDFASYLSTFQDYRITAVADGEATSGSWVSSKVTLPNEVSIFGTHHGISEYSIFSQQLAAFRLNPSFANIRVDYWLRDVGSDTMFMHVVDSGGVNSSLASEQLGVRPIVIIASV